jgi:outer membrane lipoprotein SlyB
MGRLNRKLNLNVLSEDEADQIRESHISQSMSGMKGAIRQLDVDVNVTREAVPAPQATPRYEGTELADVAREVYRENINPVKVEYQDEGPDTHARRVEKRSIQRAIMGLRNGGDEGKTSMVGPNGSGNVGKYSPSAESGSGNATNNTDNYYALTTDMTLEEYQEHIDNKLNEALGTLAGIGGGALLGNALGGAAGAALPTSKGILGMMGGKAAGVGAGKALGTVGGAVGGGMLGNQLDKKEKKEVKEDAVKDLKLELMKMEDTSWQAIDKVMRQIAKENYMTPKELHKEFKAQSDGQIPDEWIKEHREVEMAGFIPLQELARLNPAGVIYTVTYMYRGGTQRRKFLVPHMEPPTKEEMEEYVRGFWPFARVLAYYPDPIDNQQNNNSMVAVPPITEKYRFYQESDWVTLSEEEVEIFNTICEEEGEPLTSPEQQADGTFLVLIADHDTGEHKYVTFGESKEDPGDERKLAKAGAERQNAVAKLMQDREEIARRDVWNEEKS